MVRPSFILGGKGTGIAEDAHAFGQLAAEGLAASPVGQILVEKSIAGWKEYELEVMRDAADNCVVVCSIENFDPMGVHTGDSITVAPAQTLTDVEYQAMRDDAFACLRRVGVETGGSNVQFAVEPTTGRRVIIEMNPRVSRSSALASKATGFPIAKIAARLAVGYLLNEIPNDITKATPASFEPTIDYVVTKIPRWAFEKLPGADARLGTRMQSVGRGHGHRPHVLRVAAEGVALARSRAGRGSTPTRPSRCSTRSPTRSSSAGGVATPERIFELEAALRRGAGVDQVVAQTGIDPWFVRQLTRIVANAGASSRRPRWVRRTSGGPSGSGSRTPSWPTSAGSRRPTCGRPGSPSVCGRPSRPWTPAPPSSRPSRRTTTPPTRRRTRSARPTRRPRDHPRFGTEPDRPGHRVRLLLRARVHDPARCRATRP